MNLAILVCALAYVLICIYDRLQKKIAYSVHVQGKTEMDEVMDLTVILYKGESVDSWKARLTQAYELKEWRLGFQVDRLLTEQEKQQRELDMKKAIELKLTEKKG